MKKLIIVLMVVSMAALLFTGCIPTTNTPPVITSTPVTAGTIGTAYTYTVTATDADGDTLTYAVTGPTGMVIDSATGVISGWTPAAPGTEAVTVTVSDGTDSVIQSFNITVPPIGPAEITIEVAGEYFEAATGKTYVKGGSREITVTFPAAVDNPLVKVGTVIVPVFSLDNKVWKGNGHFTGDCGAVLIEVSGVCEELCAAKSVVVDSGNPYAELKATVGICECETGYALTITSDWSAEEECEDVPGCCGDDCSGLASWNVKIYDEYPWDECCEEDPCIEPNAELNGTECPIEITKECIDAEFVPDGDGGHWVDFFDYSFWVIATLTDNVGNEIKYYGEVITDPDGDELVHFVELYLDPTVEECTCYAEDPEAADMIIGDCDGTPTTECWEEPLEPCPEITLDPAEPVVGQPATVTIDYTLAVKPTGVVAAYVGPAFKILPLGVPEGSSALPLEKVSDYVYEANVVFGEAGDRIIYVVDACEDCPPCTENITVLPADVCPEVVFEDPCNEDEVIDVGAIPGYGLTDIYFNVTFANPIEKELVKVYVGIPGLAPIAMPIVMPPNALQVAMTTDAEEQTYNGIIPLGKFKDVLVDAINHLIDPLQVDPNQPLEALAYLSPEIVWAIQKLGCIPLKIYVLTGDPCCIEVCEYPFWVDPIGPFANIEVKIEECCIPCATPGCDPCEYPGHRVTIEVETPEECLEEECCDDTCSGIAGWEIYVCTCAESNGMDPTMPLGPFDECCDFIGCVEPDCSLQMYDSGTDCPVAFDSGCIYDWADPYGANPVIPDMDINDIWTGKWYMYLKMWDNCGNTTEYKARMMFDIDGPFDTGNCWTVGCDTGEYWEIDIHHYPQPLCDDAYDDTFGADFCVGEHF